METYTFLVAGAGIGAILLIYFLVLKLSDNSWAGGIPPGPRRVPVLGNFVYIRSIKNLEDAISDLFSRFGSVVRLGLFGWKICLVKEKTLIESLLNSHLLEQTHLTLINILHVLNLPRPNSRTREELLSGGRELYKEISSQVHESKFEQLKLSILWSHMSEPASTLSGENQRIMTKCVEEVKKLEKSILENPLKFCPVFCWSPHYIFEFKRLKKGLMNVKKMLAEILPQSSTLNEAGVDELQYFFFQFLLVTMSQYKEEDGFEDPDEDEVSEDPNSIAIVKEDKQFGLNISGIRLLFARESCEICRFDIPKHTFFFVKDSKSENVPKSPNRPASSRIRYKNLGKKGGIIALETILEEVSIQ